MQGWPTSADSVRFRGLQFGMDREAELKMWIMYFEHADKEWWDNHAGFGSIFRKNISDAIMRILSGEAESYSLDGQVGVFKDYVDALQKNGLTHPNPQVRSLARFLIREGKRLVRENKLHIGLWYRQPDLFLISPVGLWRNIKKGMDLADGQYDVKDFVALTLDQFGLPEGVPKLLAGVGVEELIGCRAMPLGDNEFFWKSDDGSKVLVYRHTDNYGQAFLHDRSLSMAEKMKMVVAAFQKAFATSKTGNVLIPFGYDMMPLLPTEVLKAVKEAFPAATVTNITDFMKAVQKSIQGREDKLQVLNGPMLDNTVMNILPGVYSSRLYIKQAMRRMEHRLIWQTEPLVALTQTMLPYKGKAPVPYIDLAEAWEKLLDSQPHDNISGSVTDSISVGDMARYAEAESLANRIDDSVTRLALTKQLANTDQWIIYNNSDKPYSGVVPVEERAYPRRHAPNGGPVYSPEDGPPETRLTQVLKDEEPMVDDNLLESSLAYSDISMKKRQGLIWVENVPAHGYKVISRDAKLTPQNPVRTIHHRNAGPGEPPIAMSNGLITLGINPHTGSLTVRDEQTGKVYKDLHQIIDQPDRGDSYTSGPVPGALKDKARFVGVKLVTEECGPLKMTLELHYKFPHDNPKLEIDLTTRVSLEANNPQIQFETAYINTRPAHKMQVVFPMGGPVDEVRAESLYGIETRKFDPYYNETREMPLKPGVRELKANTGPIQRFILSKGKMITTEGLTEYEVSGKNLNITLGRFFEELSSIKTGARGDQAGPPGLKTPDGQMMGKEFKFRYAWQPAPATDSEAYNIANRFYGVVYGEQGRAEPSALPDAESAKSMVSWNNPNVISTSVKWADNGKGLLVQVLNTSNQPQQLMFKTGFSYKKLLETNFLEKPVSQRNLKKSGAVIKPYGVGTFLFKVETTEQVRF